VRIPQADKQKSLYTDFKKVAFNELFEIKNMERYVRVWYKFSECISDSCVFRL